MSKQSNNYQQNLHQMNRYFQLLLTINKSLTNMEIFNKNFQKKICLKTFPHSLQNSLTNKLIVQTWKNNNNNNIHCQIE